MLDEDVDESKRSFKSPCSSSTTPLKSPRSFEFVVVALRRRRPSSDEDEDEEDEDVLYSSDDAPLLLPLVVIIESEECLRRFFDGRFRL